MAASLRDEREQLAKMAEALDRRCDERDKEINQYRDELDAAVKELVSAPPERVDVLGTAVATYKSMLDQLFQEKQQLSQGKQWLFQEEQRLLRIIYAGAGAAAGPSSGLVGAPDDGPPKELQRVAMPINITPSVFGNNGHWRNHTGDKAPDKAALFGFRPGAELPAVPHAGLVAPEFQLVVDAVHRPLPPDMRASLELRRMMQPALELCQLMSHVYDNELELQTAFIEWRNDLMKYLDVGHLAIIVPSRPASDLTDGQLVVGGIFVAEMEEYKILGGEPLMQGLRYYQRHYKDGEVWQSSPVYQADPLPMLLLLVEGPRFSIFAVWTIYQNRVAYAPLTPSYYMANEGPTANANIWRIAAVLGAYVSAVGELYGRYSRLLEQLEAPIEASEDIVRRARLRNAASLYQRGAQLVERPCTLPYSLLEPDLALEHVAFAGNANQNFWQCIYRAVQRSGGRKVMIKFVEGPYGEEVHRAWHSAGLAPALHELRELPGGYRMVLMEDLLDGGWQPLSAATWSSVDDKRRLAAAITEALKSAHGVPLAGGGRGVHGDCRGPNIMVRWLEPGADVDVKFIDFDWAGRDGEATYPPGLSTVIKWHPDVAAGAVMAQAHDLYLLQHEWSEHV